MSDPARWDEHARLSIDGSAYEVVGVRGEEALSTLFRYDVTAATPHAGADPKELLSHDAELVLSDGLSGERVVRGIVAEARLTIEDAGEPRLVVTLRPQAYLLSLGRRCVVFQDASVAEIIESVVHEARVRARLALARSYGRRVYTAQFEESSWSFLGRLCEEEGIYTWFDHDEGGSAIVFADTSTSAPDLAGGPRVAFATGTGMTTSVETIGELGPVVELTPTRFSLGSFDPQNPRFRPAAHAGHGELAVYDAPGDAPADERALAARAATMREAAEAARVTVGGKSTSARLTPGRVVEVVGHPAARFDRRFLVTEITVDVVQRRRGAAAPATSGAKRARELLRLARGAAGSPMRSPVEVGATDGARQFEVAFRALDGAVPYRAPLATPTPLRPGLQTGVVVGPPGEEVHPDATGRVRVQLHWDREGKRDDRSGRWMRVVQRGTAGSMLLPRVGWNVVTMNVEGAPDLPAVVSRLFDAEHPPPYPLPENKTRQTFRTATTPSGASSPAARSSGGGGGDPVVIEGRAAGGGGGGSNEIRYENKAGAEEMFIHASGDMTVLVQDAKSEDIKSTSTRMIAANRALEVGQNFDETIGGVQTIFIGGNDTETVGKARDKTVGKDESSTIGASRHLAVKGSNETSVAGTRDLGVGVAQIDLSIGNIQLKTAMLKEFVGVAAVRVTPRDISESVGAMGITASAVAAKLGVKGLAATAAGGVKLSVGVGGVVQTIGGAKIELCALERTISTTKSYSESVGGMMIVKALDKLTEMAPLLDIQSRGALEVRSKTTLHFVADDSIEIACGGSKITITPQEVRIHAPSLNLAGAKITATAARIDHNV